MSRRYVNQLGPQDAIDQIFLASEKQLRPNRNGNLYLQVELSDRSGTIGARMWNATEEVYRGFDNGDYVHVEGSTQLFQGNVQMIVTRLGRVDPSEVNEDDFQPLAAVEVDQLVARLGEMLRDDGRLRAAQPGRVLPAGRSVHGQVHPGSGGREEPPCLSRRPVGAHGQPDGVGRCASRRAIRNSTATCC